MSYSISKNKVLTFLKSKMFLAFIVGFVLSALIFSGNDKELIQDYEYYKERTETLTEVAQNSKKNINDLERKIQTLQNKLDDPKIQEGVALLDKKESVLTLVENKSKEIEELDKEINQKTEILRKKQEEPITVNAGQYFFGADIPSGRYIASPIGRGTNLFIYDSNGGLHVNTILSRGDYSFIADEGFYLQTEGQIKLTPVE